MKNLKFNKKYFLKYSALFMTIVTTSLFSSSKEEVKAQTASDNGVIMSENTITKEDQEQLNQGAVSYVKVEPTGYTYAELYETVNAVKQLIEEATVACPILYDIEPLMDASVLRANCLLAEEFCNKLEANGCYVGLYGNASAMNQFEQKFQEVTKTASLDFFDKLICQDQEDYLGIHHMEKDENGVFYSKYDLAQVITDEQLNKKENFVTDQTVIVDKDKGVEDIALEYQIKEADLLRYHGYPEDFEVPIGTQLCLPNRYPNKKIRKTEAELEQWQATLPHLKKGIDVSYYQGEIDWKEIAPTIDFAIIRLCDFCYQQEDTKPVVDEQFLRNMEACEAFGIPVGVYYFSRAETTQEARDEATFVGTVLQEYSLEYPVYIDLETDFYNEKISENAVEVKEMVTEALSTLEEQGYFAGVYCNKGTLQDTKRQDFITELKQQYTFWVTSNATYNTQTSFDQFKKEDYDGILTLPDEAVSMYQYSCQGVLPGIEGFVDFNYALDTLPKTIEQYGFDEPRMLIK